MVATGLVACRKEKGDFPNFDYTTGYFPYQYPVRTLILGDYIYDNSNDNNHEFWISAAMGGVYSNTQDRVFDIEPAPDLCDSVLFQPGGDTIRLMPSSYYTLSSNNKLVIPAGQVNGHIVVHLNDAFFNDPLAVKLGYVIPIRIVGVTNVDSVLRGQSVNKSPDPRILSLWSTQPKDFTMFAVNFINAYSGTFLHRGISIVKDESGAVLETNVYRTSEVVDDELWSLKTISKNQVTIQADTHSTLFPGPVQIDLTFSDDGSCTIAGAAGSSFSVTGKGKFVKDGDEWGDQKRNAIYINYQFASGGDTYSATDTLVIRDRAVSMQEYKPVVF